MAKVKDVKPVEIMDTFTLPENHFVAKGMFNTVKGVVNPGDIVDMDDLICPFVELVRMGLA